MKLRNIILTVGIAAALTGCYRDELATFHNELGILTNTRIKPLNEQLEMVKESVSHIEAMDETIKTTVAQLEQSRQEMMTKLNAADQTLAALEKTASEDKKAEMDALKSLRDDMSKGIELLNEAIAALSAKGSALDERIKEMKALADEDIKDVYDEFKKVADDIAGIESEIEVIRTSLTTLENSISGRLTELKNLFGESLSKEMSDVTAAYMQAISDMRNDVMLIAGERIDKAIAQSRTSINQWVNDELLSAYYTIALIDEKVRLLQNVDKENASTLVQLRENLEQMKVHVEESIRKAIEEARIDERIAEAIKGIKEAVALFRQDTDKCLDNISSLFSMVASLELQAQNIQKSIDALEGMDLLLKGYIDAIREAENVLGKDLEDIVKKMDVLSKDADDNYRALRAISGTLDAFKADLSVLEDAQQRIEARKDSLVNVVEQLRIKFDSDLTTTKERITSTFTTVDEYDKTVSLVSNMQESIKDINSRMASLEQGINARIGSEETELLKAISDAMSAFEQAYTSDLAERINTLDVSLRGWVNEQLTSLYWTKAETQAQIAILEKAYKDKDAVHEQQLSDLRKAVDGIDLKVNCDEWIRAALEEEDGVINVAITNRIGEYRTDVLGRIADSKKKADDLSEYLSSLEDRVATIEGQISNIQGSLTNLAEADKVLDKYINDFLKVLGNTDSFSQDILKWVAALQKNDEDIKKAIEALETSISTRGEGTIGTTIQGWIDATIKTYYESSDIEKLFDDVNANIIKLTEHAETTLGSEGVMMAAFNALKEEVDGHIVDFGKYKEKVGKSFTDNLETAKSYTDGELKDTLAYYYTKVEIDEKLAKLTDDLEKDYKAKLAALEKDVTERYEALIRKAFDTTQAAVNQGFSDALAAVRGGYKQSLKTLADEISALVKRTDELEGRIQSIVYIPDYNDFRADFNIRYVDKNCSKGDSFCSLKFKIDKAGKEPFSIKAKDESGKAKYHVSTLWKSVGEDIMTGTIDSVDFKSIVYKDGVMSLSLDGTAFPDSFYTGGSDVYVCLRITSTVTGDKVDSDYVMLYPSPIITISNLKLNTETVEEEFEFNYREASMQFDIKSNSKWRVEVQRVDGVTTDWLSIIQNESQSQSHMMQGSGDATVYLYASRISYSIFVPLSSTDVIKISCISNDNIPMLVREISVKRKYYN